MTDEKMPHLWAVPKMFYNRNFFYHSDSSQCYKTTIIIIIDNCN